MSGALRSKRTKTGCITCRIRRVKCDEEKPICQRCKTSGVLCDGYTAEPVSRQKLIHLAQAQAAAGVRGPAANFIQHHTTSRLSSSASPSSDERSSTPGDTKKLAIPPTASSAANSRSPSPIRVMQRIMPNYISSPEIAYFDFFRARTVPMVGRLLASHFWTKLVLQMAYQEPAIKHAVLALSALHQRFENRSRHGPQAPSDSRRTYPKQNFNGPLVDTEIPFMVSSSDIGLTNSSQRDELSQYAAMQYQKAIVYARDLIEKRDNTAVIMAACVIFICYENMMGRYDVARLHRHSGERILQQLNGGVGPRISKLAIATAPHTSDALPAIAEVFGRIDFEAMTLSDSRAPYRYTMESVVETMPLSPLTVRFHDLNQAWSCMMDDIRWLFKVPELIVLDTISLEQYALLHTPAAVNMREWEIVLNEFGARKLAEADIARLTLLRIYYEITRILIDTGFFGPELRWDTQMERFQKLLVLCREVIHSSSPPREAGHKPGAISDLPGDTIFSSSFSCTGTVPDECVRASYFTLEPGVIIPLYLTAHRCRDPSLRRTAVSLLRASWRLEGIWDSLGAAAVAERIIQIEEEGLGLDVVEELLGLEGMSSSLVSEDKRIVHTMVKAYPEKREVNVTMLTGLSTTTEIIRW